MSYSEVIKPNFDAGIYREYIVKNYGSVLVYGGLYGMYSLAIAHCKRLSKLVKMSVEQVIDDIKSDYKEVELC